MLNVILKNLVLKLKAWIVFEGFKYPKWCDKSCDFKSEIWWLEDVLEEGAGILGHHEGAVESLVGGSENLA